MPLPLPNLDNRTYEQLRAAALQQIETNLNTNWNDLGPGDPGVVLLEAFAYLTEQMLYRLNRVPEKLYIAFLRLLGVTLFPPTAAQVTLRFWQSEERDTPILVPRGTRVTMSGGSGDAAPVFVTAAEVEVQPTHRDKESAVPVTAYHCDLVEEPLGVGTGRAGLTFTVQQPPLVANVDLAVGVELLPTKQATVPPKNIRKDANGNKGFRLWAEVENFSGLEPNSQVYTVDRQAGTIQFAPAARLDRLTPSVTPLAAIPANGREIRIWYARGGGAIGNVRAGALDTVVAGPNGEALQGLTVTNPKRATGGMDAESVENALIRGPHSVYAHQRVVTARDYEYEVLKQQQRTIARAKAYAMGDLWQHAIPGTVQVTLVPCSDDKPVRVSRSLLRQWEAEHEQSGVVEAIRVLLEAKSPLGTRIAPRWARYKEVTVHANLVVTNDTDPEKVKERVLERLYRFISPLPSLQTEAQDQLGIDNLPAIAQAGWPFGQPLRVGAIYRLILAKEEKTVKFINDLTLTVAAAPDQNVTSVVADHFQPHTWYAASQSQVLRSTNDGDGWEPVLTLTATDGTPVYVTGPDGPWTPQSVTRDETVIRVCANPNQPGMVAAAAQHKNGANEAVVASPLYVSSDCGESWYKVLELWDKKKIHDMAWLPRPGAHPLLLATDNGLYAIAPLAPTGAPQRSVAIPITVEPGSTPLYAVTVVQDERGLLGVAVARQKRQGVYYAPVPERGGTAYQFKKLEVKPSEGGPAIAEDFRHLKVQRLDDEIYLWAGAMALGDQGKGCYRWQLDPQQNLFDEGDWINPPTPADKPDDAPADSIRRAAEKDAKPSEGLWTGGSCYALAFHEATVLAVTAWGGLLALTFDARSPNKIPPWRRISTETFPRYRAPLSQDRDLFLPLTAIDVKPVAKHGQPTIMVGGETGIYRVNIPDGNMAQITVDNVGQGDLTRLRDAVTLPPGWLVVSGEHDIQVSTYAEAQHYADAPPETEATKPDQPLDPLNEEQQAGTAESQPTAPSPAIDEPVVPSHPDEEGDEHETE